MLGCVGSSASETDLEASHAYDKESTTLIHTAMQSGLLLCIRRTSSPVSSPFIPYSLLESTIVNTHLGDAVGYLLIETVGREETAIKIGECVNVIERLAVDFYIRNTCSWSFCRLKHYFSLHIVSSKPLVAAGRESTSKSLKIIFLVGNNSAVVSMQEVTKK